MEAEAELASSMIELLSQQHSGPDNELGMRLVLHYDCIARLEFQRYPYHYCATTGNTALALHLYTHGIQSHQQVFIASLTSGGLNGQTPWQKALDATPADAARLAGHARLGSILDNMEAGVPLTWHPAVHHMYPAACRERVRGVVRALCGSAWFVHLPGPARAGVCSIAVDEACREAAWGAVEPGEWRAAQQGEFGSPIQETLLQLLSTASQQQGATGGTSRTSSGGSGGSGGSSRSGGGSSSNPGSPRALGLAGCVQGPGTPSRADVARQAQEQLISALAEPLRQFQFRMAFNQGLGGVGGAAAMGVMGGGGGNGGAGQGTGGKGRWLRLILGSVVPLAAMLMTAQDCRRLKREQLAVYVAGTLAGLQLPGALIMIAQLFAGRL